MERRLADSLVNLARAQSNFDAALNVSPEQELAKGRHDSPLRDAA